MVGSAAMAGRGEMPSDLTALAARASRTLVAAASADDAAADEWRTAQRGVAELLVLGNWDRERRARRWLDQTRDRLQAASGRELKQARADLEVVWRTRLEDLLEEQPDAEVELRRLVGQIKAELADRKERKPWRDALQPFPKILGFYKDNAFAGILLAAGFVVLKGYVLARGDLDTALGILQYAGLATVVTAGLLSSLPILAAAMLAYTVSRVTWPPIAWLTVNWRPLAWLTRKLRSERQEPPPYAWRLLVVTLGAFVLAAVFTPWTYLSLAIVIGLVIAGMRSLAFSPWVAWPVYGVVALIALVLVILSLYVVWVPHEVVQFRPGTLPAQTLPYGKQVGYVLSEDNGWITMLTSDTRHIVRYPDADVMTQMVCERRPERGDIWSQFGRGATLWVKATIDAPYLHPTANFNCPF
jgi:hypothetical protein